MAYAALAIIHAAGYVPPDAPTEKERRSDAVESASAGVAERTVIHYDDDTPVPSVTPSIGGEWGRYHLGVSQETRNRLKMRDDLMELLPTIRQIRDNNIPAGQVSNALNALANAVIGVGRVAFDMVDGTG